MSDNPGQPAEPDHLPAQATPPVPASPTPPRPATPEPARPEPPGVVISDADRDAVLARIHQALADDALDFEELDERFALVYRAETQDELRAAVSDLPELTRLPPARDARHLVPRSSFSILGDTKIGGWLTVDGDINSVNLIGDTVIDLSSADLPSAGVTITASGLIGDIKVIVPDGVRVQSDVSALIGDTKERLAPPLAGMPIVRVRGFLLLGDVGVYSLSQVPVGPLRRLWAALRGGSTDR